VRATSRLIDNGDAARHEWPMRVFMTGATGFVGRASVLRLQRDGHQIVAWVRSPSRARSLLGADVELCAASSGDEGMQRALERCQAVVNLAGEPLIGRRWTATRRATLVESRVGLTRRITDALSRCANGARPRVFVSASGIGYYGDRGEQVLTEGSSPGDDFAARLCVDWEGAALSAADANVRVVCLRLGLVLGRDGGPLALMRPAFEVGLGGPQGGGRQFIAWIHLDDAAELIARAMTDASVSGPINVVAPEPLRNRDFASALGTALQRPAVLPVPAFALRLLFGEAAFPILASLRVVPTALQHLGFEYSFPELGTALLDVVQNPDLRIDLLGPGTPAPASASAYLAARHPRYVLQSSVALSAPRSELFTFFSRAENLGLMTPATMAFEFLDLPNMITAGSRIAYRLRIAGVPLRWRTCIEHWQPEGFFVDSQEQGPYRAWWHEHHFEPHGTQTRMLDRVFYAPPLGFLGRIANRLFVARQLRQVFGYRSAAIRLRFGSE
jgi:uncharacterized protein (TIGR01777 family)